MVHLLGDGLEGEAVEPGETTPAEATGTEGKRKR